MKGVRLHRPFNSEFAGTNRGSVGHRSVDLFCDEEEEERKEKIPSKIFVLKVLIKKMEG